MMGNDGAKLRGSAYELFPPELMADLRAWAAERRLEGQLPGLMLLVAHLGQAGMVVADYFYNAGIVAGMKDALAHWDIALREPRRPEGEGDGR